MSGINREKLNELAEVKIRSSFNKPIKDAVKFLAINYDQAIIFGSYLYKKSLYPGDIDIREIVDEKDVDKIVKLAKEKIQSIAKNLPRDTYLGDVKAGIDEVYNIDIGSYDYKKGLVDYNYKYIKEYLGELYERKLLEAHEYWDLLDMVVENPTYDEYQLLHNSLREYFLLRWDKDELEKGQKTLRGNRIKYLSDAIKEPSHVKVDIWAPIYNRYIEITNFFILITEDKNGKKKFLNRTCFDVDTELRKEIFKYSTKYYFKPLKMVKRMWSLARNRGDLKMLEKLTPIIQSGAAILYQISSEIETLIMMLEDTKYIKNPPYHIMMKQLDEFKTRLAYVSDLKFDEKKIDKQLDYITKNYKTLERKDIVNLLEDMKDYFKGLTNDNVLGKLKKLKLYPPPANYLPK